MEAIYEVEVTTGSMTHAGTFDNIFITLIGTQGQSERTKLDSYGRDFKTGMKVKYKVTTRFTLGNLLLIRLEKDNFIFLPENDWFCSNLNVRTPEKDMIYFPSYRWIGEEEVIELREAKATKIYDEKYSQLKEHRKNELTLNKQVYQWTEFKTGLPQCSCFQEPLSLPSVVRFSFTKDMNSAFNISTALGEIKMKKLVKKPDQWVQMEDMKSAFWSSRTTISEYVQLHWMDDEFFGHQLLNGPNPMMLRRCSELPLNFAVNDGMVQSFLGSGTSLTLEMKQGNIFLCDYKRLADLPTQFINGKQQYVAAPLCLLYKNQMGKLLPIAIQLQQQASDDNPVFLPSDCEYDWQLAKLYVRNADCLEHQASFYLRTHLLAETFTISLLRNLPAVHPIHKVLKILSGEEFASMHYAKYKSDDFVMNLVSVSRFVRSMVEFYYQSDGDVQRDTELQDWIKEIFIRGFLEQSSTGIPQCFSTVEEVIKFVTMVIFTVSAQHSALGAGQFDYGSWFPNAPGSLKRPPPTSKGSSDKNTLLDTLPDMNTSAYLVSFFWLLSKPSSDLVSLGQYPEDYFCQMAPQKMIRGHQAELSFLSESIKDRNAGMQVPYTYMCPDTISNSVSI
ncbi:Hydroperoxide isomerase ALOXE3 [Anabarilius grahami]|uniref:Hydroperoxide isomerase ALOXE3 n=1 Tax=Anabarilius grahami TaxID=495550 RepID=A0A3N0YN81_ANAGA|nr:Hydroperoxide isomerase ALOXE3 [Anabarilius grahami]